MAYWSLTTYSRPDKSKEWFVQDTVDEIKAETYAGAVGIGRLIVDLENAGKITHYSISESNDGLKQYIKLGFDSKDSFDKLYTDIDNLPDFNETRSAWLEANGLTSDLAQSESEPTITL